MKAKDLKKCGFCGKGMAHAGTPLFYRVKIETFGLDQKAILRRAGEEQMMGGGVAGVILANVVGSDPDVAVQICDQVEALVCQPCAVDPANSRPLAFLMEAG